MEGDIANLPAEPPEGELPQPEKEKSLPAVSTLPVVAVNPPVNPPLAPKRSVGEPARAAPPGRNGSTVREAPGVAEREIRDLRRQLSQARVENEQLNDIQAKIDEANSAISVAQDQNFLYRGQGTIQRRDQSNSQ